MSMRETNILLTAVGRRAYLVEYFKEALRGTGGKVYAANCVRDTTGLLAADDFEIVPKSADPGYVDSLVELCRRWRIALLFSLHDWDAPVIARNRERFLAVGTTPVMGDARLLSTCLDKYSTASAMEEIGVAVPWTTLSLSDAAAKMRELNAKRREKQPLDLPSAGSAFKRPEGGFAAALIDEAGLKGYTIGGAQVSEKHAGFVVNIGGASSHDVHELMRHIRRTVYEHSKVALEPEMIILPPDYKLEDHGPQVPLHTVWGGTEG